MRTLATFPYQDFNLTIFYWNQKYILKYEQGDLEQTYKISELEVTGEEEVREIAQKEEFINQIQKRFEEMRDDFATLFAY